MSVKRIDIKEFRDKGYLQEVNRLFFHPLGLALEVQVNEDGSEQLGGVWDYRDDPEGIIYDIANSTDRDKMKAKADTLSVEMKRRLFNRMRLLGFGIEPFNNTSNESDPK